MPADQTTKLPPSRRAPLTLDESEALLIQAGVDPDFISRTSMIGLELADKGDLDFAVGALVQEIQHIKDTSALHAELYKSAVNEKVKADILGQIAKLSNAMTGAVKELAKLQAQNVERRRKGKNKSKSFTPEQHVTAVQVTVNNTPLGPPASKDLPNV